MPRGRLEAKTKTPLATAVAKCDAGIQPVARRPLADIRFYLDPDTGLPHIYGRGVTEEEVEQVLRASGGDVQGRRGSGMKLSRTSPVVISRSSTNFLH